MAPPLFADLSKTSNDLFVKDYKDFNSKVEVTSKVLNGVNLKATFTKSEKDFASVLEFKKRIQEFDITAKITAKSEKTITVEHGALIPNLKLKGESTIGGASTVTGEYKVKEFSGSVAYDISKGVATLTGVTTVSGLSLGLSTTTKDIATPHIKAQYNGDGYEVGASVENLGDKLGLSLYQNVKSNLAVAVSLDQSKSNLNLGLGLAFTPDKDASIRGKVDSAGYISALYTQKLCPSTTLKVLGSVNTRALGDGSAHKFGVNLLVAA